MTRVIQGSVHCNQDKSEKQLPIGSVIYFYLYQGQAVVARQSLHNVISLPAMFKLEFESDSDAQTYVLQVSVENGETMLYANEPARLSVDFPQQKQHSPGSVEPSCNSVKCDVDVIACTISC